MIEKIKNEVKLLMSTGDDGHGFDHIERVYNLAMTLADKEQAHPKIVALAALLHDVDDYKLFGEKTAAGLLNARRIMGAYPLSDEVVDRVCNIIHSMGYSKALKGIRPQTIEGKVVSDADMLDAMGATGIIRNLAYTVTRKERHQIFEPEYFPKESLSSEEYKQKGRIGDNFINHYFEKILKLKNMMMTAAGYEEACRRHRIMVDFMRAFFEEQGRDDWLAYLENYERENAKVPLQIRRIA